MRFVLLPGMDGTGDLFKPLLKQLPRAINPQVISYPLDKPLGYAGLINYVRSQLPRDEEFVLLGESFSGPIALALASGKLERMRALILVCTFQNHPRPLFAAFSLLAHVAFRLPPPKFAIQLLLTNGAPDLAVAAEVQSAIGQVKPKVLSARLSALAALPLEITQMPTNLPCLYLLATHDRLVPRSCYDDIRRHIPQTNLACIDGPHCLLQVKPDACADAITQFLKTTSLLG
jgi:sigma-B regulation protein RsbQ